MTEISLLGNGALLKREKVGFLASRRVPPEAVMRCLDWATRMRDEGACVMSGFQSPLEREVLDILLKGDSPLVLVLARRMWAARHVPAVFRPPLAEGRLLVVSPVPQTVRRVDARSAALRNRYVVEHADALFLDALNPDGSLKELLDARHGAMGSSRPTAASAMGSSRPTDGAPVGRHDPMPPFDDGDGAMVLV